MLTQTNDLKWTMRKKRVKKCVEYINKPSAFMIVPLMASGE